MRSIFLKKFSLAVVFYLAPTLLVGANMQSQRIIITGGPGVGKTSLVNHFEKNGFHVINEAATDLIRERLSQKIDQPWNQDGFNMDVVELQLQRQAEAEARSASIVFFDRSPIDVLSYSVLQKDKEQDQITAVVEDLISQQYYHKKVFLIENLGICEQTEIRAESLEDAIRIERHIENQYLKYDYEVIRIPPASIEERASLILKHLGVD